MRKTADYFSKQCRKQNYENLKHKSKIIMQARMRKTFGGGMFKETKQGLAC